MPHSSDTQFRLDPNRLIAAVGTLIVALLLLLVCLVVRMPEAAAPSHPENKTLEMASIEPDETPEFIEPMLLEDAGDLDAARQTEPAPVPDGTPDQAEVPQPQKVVNGENPTPNPSQERLVSTTKPSPKQTADPTPKETPDSRIAANMKGQFSPHNGQTGGSTTPSAQSGSGGTGSGVSGTLKGGRKLISCPMPGVKLSRKEVIKVEVYVNAAGKVTEANVISGSSDSKLRSACLNASLKAKWTPQPDAPRTRGVITWTLVPKV